MSTHEIKNNREVLMVGSHLYFVDRIGNNLKLTSASNIHPSHLAAIEKHILDQSIRPESVYLADAQATTRAMRFFSTPPMIFQVVNGALTPVTETAEELYKHSSLNSRNNPHPRPLPSLKRKTSDEQEDSNAAAAFNIAR